MFLSLWSAGSGVQSPLGGMTRLGNGEQGSKDTCIQQRVFLGPIPVHPRTLFAIPRSDCSAGEVYA